MIHDVIIVGSGPTGAASALGFVDNGVVPLVLDVGHEPGRNPEMKEGFYEYRRSHDSFDMMIGKDYEGLYNLLHEKMIFPKFISPFMQYVVRDAEKLSPINEKGFIAVQSFAKGGLANAWGAGMYRCLEDELKNIPLSSSELSPYYDKLTREIGIAGDVDDLTPFFGTTRGLLGPLRLSRKAEMLLSIYMRRKKKLNEKGIHIGRPRLCVLSQDHDNRSECTYNNLESWFPSQPYIYTPAFTIKKLVDGNKLKYKKNVLVKSWERKDNHLIVNAENIDDGSIVAFKCKKLILAAGTINSAKIVLNSKKDYETKLPIFDNTLIQIPLIFPKFIGSKREAQVLGLPNLDIVIDLKKSDLRLKGSILELTFPLKSFFTEMLPLSARDNLTFMKYFLQSLLALLLYFPSNSRNSGYIMLRKDGTLEAYSPPYVIERKIIKDLARSFTSLGVLTHPFLMQDAQPGYAVHYAGTLPMVENPNQDYQCSKMGELYNEPGVYVVDGSLFSYIPAKNISFTFMANAMRIADYLSGVIKRQ